MSIEEFTEYIWENFDISGESLRLIRNIFQYAQSIADPERQYDFLCSTLDGTIGLSEREIRMISI